MMVKNGSGRLSSKIPTFLTSIPMLVRNVYAETLLEDFFVSAVASVLVIRFYLYISGFPQLSFGPFHIAHMLWGGFLMLIALVILLAFLNYHMKVVAAVVGGIGFGAFIDELGKFVTRDNDYFFQPTVALIYVVFVLIFFIIRFIVKRQPLSSQECLANAFDIAEQGSMVGISLEEQVLALKLLENCPRSIARDNLETILQNIQVTYSSPSRLLSRLHNKIDRFYEWAVHRWWFAVSLSLFLPLAR